VSPLKLPIQLDPGVAPEIWERSLVGPARDFLSRPGKNFRGRLVESSWRLAGGQGEMPIELAEIVEVLHAGSLIIDDIQDDSDERRGQPTLHRVYGTAVAINTGNWLYFWPFVLLGRLHLPSKVRLDLYQRTSMTMMHCHQGQALDLSSRVFELDPSGLPSIVETATRLKTGSLMELAASLGAIVAGASHELVETLSSFGRELGIGLQMLDDLGSITSPARARKGREDLKLARPTWPWSWAATDLSATAMAELAGQLRAVCDGEDPDRLRTALGTSVGPAGRQRIAAHLDAALAGLRDKLPEATALDELAEEIARLRRSYD